MWDFQHEPGQSRLRNSYDIELTMPSECAYRLLAGRSDLGLIPVAALTPELAVVPGCTIASLHQVRSIQLIVKAPRTLAEVRTVAADTASRSSVAYAQVLFRHFVGVSPDFLPAPANVEAMLATADAALLIGDPALLALQRREQIETQCGPCTWFDLAEEWNRRTGLPWVAAIWAVRPAALRTAAERERLVTDLNTSRDHGLSHIDELVQEWTPRIAVPPATIRHYLKSNIHYTLDDRCIEAIRTFRRLAAEVRALEPLPELNFLLGGSDWNRSSPPPTK